jgi:hypothetical protein
MKIRSLSKVLWATTLIAALPTVGWAQEATEEMPAEPEPIATTEAATEAPAARWPRAVIARPLTLPAGVFQVGLDEVSNNDVSALGSRLVAGYGINDKLEAAVFYSFATKEFEAKGSLDVNVGYAAIRGAAGGTLEVVPRAQLGYSLFGEALNPLGAGAQVQYNVSDKLAVITPGGQLSVALDGDTKPITFGLPVAVGFQATPELYLQVDTSLGSLNIADSANAFIFADSTPASLTGIYNAIPALDVMAGLAMNVTPPGDAGVGDTLAFLLGVRYYGGQL